MKYPDAYQFGLEMHEIACTVDLSPILKEISENQFFHDFFFTKKFFISRKIIDIGKIKKLMNILKLQIIFFIIRIFIIKIYNMFKF